MKKYIFIIVFLSFIPIIFANEASLPEVKETYATIKSNGYIGKKLNDIIPVENIKLIVLSRSCGKGSPLTNSFRPDWNSNILFKKLFSSNQLSQEWSQSAMETAFAEYTIVTDAGDLYFLEILGNTSLGEEISGVLVRGDSFGCRFNIKGAPNTYKAP